jgi:hypothetical protein
MQARSICEFACEVQASGLCTPDYVEIHCKDADLYSRARTRAGELPLHVGWDRLCVEIEHSRHFLFDELPDICKMGLWNDNAAALADYAKRINEPELPSRVQQLWN